jgi:bifunctional non-homologous end joining protein LigD
MGLERYREKRDFRRTPEPRGGAGRGGATAPIFVVQEHHASHLHYDFRLEVDGVLKSWAIPKGPSKKAGEKRLAVEVEDHPLSYATFEGSIPEGQYGAGTVTIWDHGTFEPAGATGSPAEALAAGKLDFVLHGQKLRGRYALIRMKRRGGTKPQWLLIKADDASSEIGTPRGDQPRRAGRSRRREDPPPVASGGAASAGEVRVTHPERVLFPDSGLTKGDLFAYYGRIAGRLLPYLKDRPITLERLPDGLTGPDAPHFWQKDTPEHYPDWIPRVEVPTEQGKTVRYAMVNDRATLLYLVNQGTVTFHIWASRVTDLDRPDFVLFDLDRGEAPFPEVVAVARAVRAVVEHQGRGAFVKTSGKTGLHVLVPCPWASDYETARSWARKQAECVVSEMPDRATTEIRKAKRQGRVYIDVLQNARGHHAVPPFVVRAVPGATVSTPLSWREVTGRLDPSAFNVQTVPRRVARQQADPFENLVASFGAA